MNFTATHENSCNCKIKTHVGLYVKSSLLLFCSAVMYHTVAIIIMLCHMPSWLAYTSRTPFSTTTIIRNSYKCAHARGY